MGVLYTSFAMPMIGSKDDKLIQNDDFGLRGFNEMVQSNYGDADAQQKALEPIEQPIDENLITNDGLVDLERLKFREREHERAEAQRGDAAIGGGNDIALQHAVARFFRQQYNEQAQPGTAAAGAAAIVAAQTAASNSSAGGDDNDADE